MSKIAVMREMLLKGKPGFTKEELATGSGVALSTVSVQLGYHLKGAYTIHREEGKRYWIEERTAEDFAKEAEAEGEEAPVDEVEPTVADLKEIQAENLDKMPADAELEALLDE